MIYIFEGLWRRCSRGREIESFFSLQKFQCMYNGLNVLSVWSTIVLCIYICFLKTSPLSLSQFTAPHVQAASLPDSPASQEHENFQPICACNMCTIRQQPELLNHNVGTAIPSKRALHPIKVYLHHVWTICLEVLITRYSSLAAVRKQSHYSGMVDTTYSRFLWECPLDRSAITSRVLILANQCTCFGEFSL